MPFLSPLDPVFETKTYPHARTYRGTFGQKLYDTYSFFGGTLLAGLRNKDPKERPHFGLFDYPTLGILYGLGLAAMLLYSFLVNKDNLATKILLAPLAATVAITVLAPRYLFAGIMTLISMPFVAIAHGVSTFKGDRLKNTILSHDVSAPAKKDTKRQQQKTTWGQLLIDNDMRLEDVETATKKPSYASKNIIELNMKQNSKEASVTLVLGDAKNKAAYDAFMQLNVGGLQHDLENVDSAPNPRKPREEFLPAQKAA